MKEFLFGLLIGALVIFLSAACGGDSPTKTVDTKKAWTYEVIDIDGMPCIKWTSGAYVGSLTCNWVEWKGEAK